MSTYHIPWISPWLGRLLISIALAVTGVTFFVVGYSSIAGQGPLLDLCFMAFAVVPVLAAIIYLWRGWRLGVVVERDQLVVRGYFPREDRVTALTGLRRIYHSVDATVLEFPDRQFAVDDCYFPDSEARDALLDLVRTYVKKDPEA
jgi:hypothetical protein